MNCGHWEERISIYAGSDLDRSETAAVVQHLAECASCRAFAAELRESLDLIRTAHQEPIAEAHYAALRSRVLTQLAEVQRPWWRERWVLVGAAALAMFAAFIATRRQSDQAPTHHAAVRYARTTPEVAAPEDLPVPVRPVRPRRLLASSRRMPGPPPLAEPIVVKLMTNDPDVVIYWIANK